MSPSNCGLARRPQKATRAARPARAYDRWWAARAAFAGVGTAAITVAHQAAVWVADPRLRSELVRWAKVWPYSIAHLLLGHQDLPSPAAELLTRDEALLYARAPKGRQLVVLRLRQLAAAAGLDAARVGGAGRGVAHANGAGLHLSSAHPQRVFVRGLHAADRRGMWVCSGRACWWPCCRLRGRGRPPAASQFLQLDGAITRGVAESGAAVRIKLQCMPYALTLSCTGFLEVGGAWLVGGFRGAVFGRLVGLCLGPHSLQGRKPCSQPPLTVALLEPTQTQIWLLLMPFALVSDNPTGPTAGNVAFGLVCYTLVCILLLGVDEAASYLENPYPSLPIEEMAASNLRCANASWLAVAPSALRCWVACVASWRAA